MFWRKCIALAFVAAASVGEARAQATVFWTGASVTSSHFDDAHNWVGLKVPANNGTQVLGFFRSKATAPNGNQMMLGAPVNALGLDIEADTGGANISLMTATGSSLTLGASGIWMNQSQNNGSSVATIAVPVVLSASQTWSLAGSNLGVTQPITGSGKALAIQETSGSASVTLSSGSSTFSGGLTVGGGAVVYAGASTSGPAGSPTSGPAGTGAITVNAGSQVLAPASTTVTLGNNVTLGGGTETLGAASTGLLVSTGVISGGGTLNAASALTLNGANTYSGGSILDSATINVGTDQGLGTGALSAVSSSLTFWSASPDLSLPSVSFDSVTATFKQAGGHPTLVNLTLSKSTLTFANNSTVAITDMTSDGVGSTNAINLGANSVLDLTVDAPTDYYGTIGGLNSSVTYGTGSTGVIDLHSANTYGGGTTIDPNVLVIAENSASLGTGGVTLNGGGAALGIASAAVITNSISAFSGGSILEGYGSLAPLTSATLAVAGGSTLVGGKGSLPLAGFAGSPVPGTLTLGSGVGTLSLGGQGIMQVSVMNASGGTKGTDFSWINAPSTQVNVTATPTTPFTIQLVSVNPATQQAGLANFNNTMPYSWTILSASSITGFSSNDFTVDSSTYFQNALGGGTFSLTESGGNALVLDFTPVPEPSTWALVAIGLVTAGTVVRRRRR